MDIPLFLKISISLSRRWTLWNNVCRNLKSKHTSLSVVWNNVHFFKNIYKKQLVNHINLLSHWQQYSPCLQEELLMPPTVVKWRSVVQLFFLRLNVPVRKEERTVLIQMFIATVNVFFRQSKTKPKPPKNKIKERARKQQLNGSVASLQPHLLTLPPVCYIL